MKKITTLALLSLATLGVNADPFLDTCKTCNGEVYWIVKDGIINENIIQLEYEAGTTGDVLVSGQTYNGETVAEFRHQAQYLDVRFDLTNAPLEMNKTWVMNIEYAIPAAMDANSVTYQEFMNEPSQGETGDGTKPAFIIGLNDEVAPSVGTDSQKGRITVQAAIDAMKSGNEFKIRKQYAFVNPTIEQINYFCISFLRESKKTLEPFYIKNLYFYGEGNKPFYAEDFTIVSATIYADNNYKPKMALPEDFHGGIVPTVSKGNIPMVRCWDKTPDESGLHGSELYHGLSVSTDKDVAIENINIPEGMKTFEVAMLIKKIYAENTIDAWNELVANNQVPKMANATLVFDNGEEIALYTDQELPSIWTWEKQTVNVPEGVKTCSLKFSGMEYAYSIDQIRMGDKLETGVEEAPAEIAAKIAIYPNPTSDILTVNTEASKMEVYSLNGSLVAEVEGNQINVASLANGLYIVRIFTEDGFVTKTFRKE